MAAMGIDVWIPQAAPCQQFSSNIWRDQAAPEIVSEILTQKMSLANACFITVLSLKDVYVVITCRSTKR